MPRGHIYTDETIFETMRSVGYLAPHEWRERGLRPSARWVRQRYGGWHRAWQQAGIDPDEFAKERLLAPLRERGKYATYAQMARAGVQLASIDSYQQHFGSFRGAWIAARISPAYPRDPQTLQGFGDLPRRTQIILTRRWQGDSLATIAAALDITREHVRRLARQAWQTIDS